MKTIRKTLHKLYDILSSFNLRNNTTLKLLSLAFAFVLWIFVMDQVNPEITRTIDNVRVEFVNQSEAIQRGFVFNDLETYNVDVTVKGRRNIVLNVSAQDLRITADLDNVQTKGKNSLLLDRVVSVPDVKIDGLSKTYVTLTVDRQGKRAKDIEITTVGELPSSYVAGEMKVPNDWVYVSGPENLVNTVDKIVGTVDLTDKMNLISKEIPIKAVDSDGNIVQGVTLEFDQITIELPIYKQKSVPIITETIGQVKAGSKLVSKKQSVSSIKIQGVQEIVDTVNVIYTQPVDITDKSGIYVVKPLLMIPDGVISLHGSSSITYEVNINDLVSKEYFVAKKDLPILNLDASLQIEIANSDETVSVKLTDVQSELSKVNIDDLEIYFDGSAITESGEYKLLVNVRLNNNLSVDKIEITPEEVDVSVSLKSTPEAGTDSQEETTTGENP